MAFGRELNKALFGETRKLESTGDHKVNPIKIAESFEQSELVIYKFCNGCGTTVAINKALANDMAERAGIKLPESLGGCYFEVSGCESCDGIRKKPEFKKIEAN